MNKPTLAAILVVLSTPLMGLARTYDALCIGNQNCKVEISYEQLVVGGKMVPIKAIASWSKSGPGSRVNHTSGPILSILFGTSASQLLATEYQATYTITYYTAEQKEDQVLIGFINKRYSRWFETELQAVTGLPQNDINDQARLFKWNSTEDSPAKENSIKHP